MPQQKYNRSLERRTDIAAQPNPLQPRNESRRPQESTAAMLQNVLLVTVPKVPMPVVLLNPNQPTPPDSSTDGSTDSVSTDNNADDVRWSWPPRRIAVLPSPLPCPPNNASINDYLTTSDGTPLFKNHLSKPADSIDGASPTENGFRKGIQEFRALNQRKLDSHLRGTMIDTTEDLVTIRSNIVKFGQA
eukprot:scaffold27537_cov45-Cyclotella_meneghiniana.AAC.3